MFPLCTYQRVCIFNILLFSALRLYTMCKADSSSQKLVRDRYWVHLFSSGVLPGASRQLAIVIVPVLCQLLVSLMGFELYISCDYCQVMHATGLSVAVRFHFYYLFQKRVLALLLDLRALLEPTVVVSSANRPQVLLTPFYSRRLFVKNSKLLFRDA